jgi:DNA-binding NarL/FixJ family response regulator
MQAALEVAHATTTTSMIRFRAARTLPPWLGSGAKLLIVSDDDRLRAVLRRVLGGLDDIGLQLFEAAALADAIELYRVEPGIALVLLDLGLPECHGLRGLKQFIGALPGAQVAVMSGSRDESMIRQVRALGAVCHLETGQPPWALMDRVLALLGFGGGTSACDRDRDRRPAFMRLPHSAQARVAALGPRYCEILDLVLLGCPDRDVAAATGLPLCSVRNCLSILHLLVPDLRWHSKRSIMS